MKSITMIIAFMAAYCLSTIPADAHGGGCRKSSPPGQCCHADNSNGGRVHYH
jgi:hypothetical protein